VTARDAKRKTELNTPAKWIPHLVAFCGVSREDGRLHHRMRLRYTRAMVWKDYSRWHALKAELNRRRSNNKRFIKERQVWYCAIGVNIGSEQDGKGNDFSRPVVIFKVFNRDIFLGIPLTSTLRFPPHYTPTFIHGREGAAILSQVRLFDRKRLIRYMGMVDQNNFSEIQRDLKALLFSSPS